MEFKSKDFWFSRMKGPECIQERTKTVTGERIHQKTVPNTNVEIRNYSEVI